MTNQLANPSVAILVANGFAEEHITAVQRAMIKEKKTYKIIAPEQGLVNGWQDNAWGHYFTVDEQISNALGSDFDMLILVGGERAAAKLKTNPHTRRIVNHFLEARKPVAAIGSSVSLLALSTKSVGLSVSVSQECRDEVVAAGMEIASESQVIDNAVLTSDGGDVEAWVEAVMQQVNSCECVDDEAVAA